MHISFSSFLGVMYKTCVIFNILLRFHLSHKLQWFQQLFFKKSRTSNEILMVCSVFTWKTDLFQQKWGRLRVTKSAILTPPPKTINFNSKALTNRTLFGQIGTDSILACFFLVFTNQFILKNVMYFQHFHKKNIPKSSKFLKYDKDFHYFWKWHILWNFKIIEIRRFL